MNLPRGTVLTSTPMRPLRSMRRLIMLAFCVASVFIGFAALGTWQLYRLQWKLELIERVEQRVHAPAVAAPGRELWLNINAADDEYRHVRVSGTFLYEKTSRVQAVTVLGSGFWLLTPLRSADGSVVLVNRGFVAGAMGTVGASEPTSDAAVTTITGLLRMSEPGGGFLRRNDAASQHWYSRDVEAIAAAHSLTSVAPYFIDADAASASEMKASTDPIGGLTVLTFHNNHLVYALTWYALALMVAGACFWVTREERRLQRTDDKQINRDQHDGKQHP